MSRARPFVPAAASLLLAVFALAMMTGPVRAGDIVEVTSPGGIVAWLKREPSIPIIALSASWTGAGTASDPAGKEGRASLASRMFDEGAGELDSQAFQRRLEDLAVDLDLSAGRDELNLQLRTLTANADEAFRMAGMALSAPRFDAEPLERIRAGVLSAIAADSRDPNAIAGDLFMARVFAGDAYGRPADGTAESVAGLTAADLRAFAGERLARDNLLVGVVGDITPEALGPLLDTAFAGLPAKARIDEAVTAPVAEGPLVAVESFDSPQTVFVFGIRGIPRDDPDFNAARVMNHILGGGGFTSMLTEEIREQRGLTYGVYSYLRPLDRGGLWLGGMSTANARAGEAWQVLRDTMRRYLQDGPDEKRLAEAKANINGAFPLSLTSNRAIAGLLVTLQREKLGMDYVERRPDLINAVTMEDVRRVARRLLDPDRLLLVAVGKPEGLPAATQ
ncbi:MAG: pitrilysin family protein [Pseudomonadota bacterium]|nr:pitrilysin family protein [Pseudomonadota bacterium]